ncbi:MAG: T9SS type A sorting domain-containing protein [Bacteroidetes bacterium]|nr:T9SS type A sorting domain-containing protein [Bacteroidota bacterium]
MRRPLLLFLAFLFSLQSVAQNPELFKTWYLYEIEFDLGDPLSISNITPSISPILSINTSLDFTGFGACNDFSGNFTYELDSNGYEFLTAGNYSNTTLKCINQEHINFEVNYFLYFSSGLPLFLQVGQTFLSLEVAPGFLLKFQDTPILSISENTKQPVYFYPNPVSNTLFISSENTLIENITVYSVLGEKVMELTAKEINSIDVSSLSEGLYLLEINTPEGRNIQKFIKK